jgi:5-formyltetrahydrofolate cyclo-ligase
MEEAGPPEGARPDKAALRSRLRAARRARTPAQRAEVAASLARAAAQVPALAALPPGAVVAAYASTPTEPGTGPLREALTARGVVVLLPVAPDRPGPLGWVGPDGAPHPAGLASADVVLLPALAVDGSGTRLGQGGGHYDRTLAGLRRPLLVAVVHVEEVLAPGALPREPHDVGVDAALTPRGLTTLGDHPPR